MSFKLLAIRPLDECNTKFLKNLEENRIYQFYNDYEFLDENKNPIKDFGENNFIEVDSIKHNPSVPNNLYRDKINISAIVGKNGSGKSSLVELLYVTFYNLSVELNIIEKSKYQEKFKKSKTKLELFLKKTGKSIINSNTFNVENEKEELLVLIETLQLDPFRDEIEILKNNKGKELLDYFAEIYRNLLEINFQDKIHTETEWNYIKKQIDSFLEFFRNSVENFDSHWSDNKFIQEIYILIDELEDEFNKIGFLVESVSLEFFYLSEGKVFCVRKFNNKNTIIIEYINKTDNIYKRNNNTKSNSISIRKKLFYNLVVNYSLYGLNSEELGNWIKRIFHKNDGYQTPIVINPFRNNGIIDINSENELVKDRLLTNMIINDKLKQITPNNKVLNLEIKIKQSNSKRIYPIDILKKQDKKYNDFISNLILFFNNNKNIKVKFEENSLNNTSLIEQYCLNYILKKLDKITTNYNIYSKFSFTLLEKGEKSMLNLRELLMRLSKDYSHITTKIRQVINFIFINRIDKEKDLIHDFFTNNISPPDINFLIKNFNFDEYSKFVNNRSAIFGLNIITLLPPPIFEIDFEFDNGSRFSQLSSGEKQQIFSLNSILYHLINLNSTKENKFPLKYPYINLILDEIELYAHPDMQRKYIKELLDGINKLDLLNILDINILFITHSPFILSDIPKQNVLFLEVDKKAISKPYNGENTFGANIHEMLTDGFFISNTKGEFVISKINAFLEDYKKWISTTKENNQYTNYKNEYDNKKEGYDDFIKLIGENYIRVMLQNHSSTLEEHFEDISPIESRKKFLEKEKERIETELRKID